MPFKKISYSYLIKIINIIIILIVFLFYGCKGKEIEKSLKQPPEKKQENEEVALEKEEEFEEISTEGPPPDILNEPINTAPRITVLNVYPQNPVAGDTVRLDVKTFDREGDSVNITYKWWKNDEELKETSNKLLITEDFKRGDKITVRLVPDDGERKGTPLEMFVYIANSPPKIIPSDETFIYDGKIYSYQVRAIDPDGDEITYTLKSAPPGMTIDEKTGKLYWNVPSDFTGKVPITVAVKDGYGGEIVVSFTLEIMPEKKIFLRL